MSDHPKISIISTVYNTGPYLRPAVESILAQTFTDFELLLVDDGSHDGSAAVCDALAQEDARIRVFHQPNGGPAHARNTGLDNARGDYIGMVDSDDLIEPTMFATLYSAVQVDGVRLAACAGDCIDADGKKIEGRMVTIRQGGVRDAQELLLEAFQTGSFYGPLSWNKLFDARLFKEKGIHYDETMLFGDDASVLHRVFEGERCNCLTDVLYHIAPAPGRSQRLAFRRARPTTCGCTGSGCNTSRPVPGARSTTTGPLCGTGRSFTSSGASPIRRATCPRSGQSLWRTKSIWMPFCPTYWQANTCRWARSCGLPRSAPAPR